MKRVLLFLMLAVSFISLNAQTFTANFTGTAASVPQTAASFKCFPVTVAGVGNINSTTNGLAQVCINITHPNDDELEINLTAPDGTIVPLSVQNGGSGNNYTGTCFTAAATVSIKAGTAPFNGMFLPEGHLGAVNNGQNANGVWNICVQDRRNGANVGALTSFSLTFSNAPAPAPPALPACSTTLPATSTCANATSVCNFSGLCGTTNGNTVQDWTGSGLDGCFGIENNSFIKFVASAASASFSVWVPTRSSGGAYFNGGIQMLFFSGTCGSGAVTPHGCYPHIYPYNAGQPIISVVTATDLTPGNTYYLMIDGFNGDHCTFTIEAISGVNILTITPPAPSVCAGSSINLTASGGTTYSWAPAATLSSPTGATVTASPTATTTYTVTSTPNGSCPITENVTVTVAPPPTITSQPSAVVQNVCIGNASVALVVAATAGSGTITGYQWYSNTTASATGGTLIAGATSATFTPPTGTVGTLYYYCVVTNSNTCSTASNISGAIAVSAALAAPVGSVTQQPTCISPNGTITITAPLGANYQYSIGGAYQASPVFTGLAPNSYNVTVKDIVPGCISPALVLVVDPVAGAPATPTATVTQQPTCSVPTGTITITAPTGANLQYSIGGTYQTGGTFTGLAPNTYSVTVKDIITGCISSPVTLVVNVVPAPPAVPTATATQQPTCASPTGTITITAPTGANLQYSIGGTYQVSPVFTALAPNTYNVTVKDIVTGCISSALPLTINAVPAPPATPTATVTQQPTCATPSGTITITAPAGASYQYSIGGPYQPGGIFTGLLPNTYNVTVKDILTGCISSSLVLIVNAIPALPAAPAATVTQQPTCIVTTGTITITSPTGANYQYSIGGTYQASGVFTGLVPNVYNVTVKDIVTGCISLPLQLTVNAVPAAPVGPTATVTQQPGCLLPTGTITVTAPIGANYQYSTGGAYQPGTVFNGLTPNTYSVTVKDIITGCISSPLSLAVNPVPAPPAIATATVTQQPTCITPTGTITVTAPTGTNLQYSIGGTYQSGGTFTGLAPDTYSVTVKDVVTGCVSAALSLTVNAVPGAPATPAGTVTQQPTCTVPTGTITIASPVGPDLQYSIGGAYQSSGVFAGLTPDTYTVIVKNTTTGCISATVSLVVNAVPAGPATPTAAVTQQPACAVSTGTITITAPTGANLQYSVGGTYQTGSVFTGLAPNTYNVTVKDITTGCVSNVLVLIVNAVPAAPATPTGSVSHQPTCTSDGVITITAPTGTGYSYSINNINYQAGTVFNGLLPGTYNVWVKNAAGCISAPLTLTVNVVPAAPATPVATVTKQPTCADNKGTITVTSPLGGDLRYSIDGMLYQPGLVFNNLAPGTYPVTVKNYLTDCESTALILQVSAVPGAPLSPAGTVVQPTCVLSKGTINITSPVGTDLQYSIDGIIFQTSTVFNNLVPGSYNVIVKNITTNCTSAPASFNINAVPNGPPVPVVTPGSVCGPGSASLSAAGTGNITWYTDAALTNVAATGNAFHPAVSVTTTYFVTNTVAGCSSNAVAAVATVDPLPVPLLGSDRTICKVDNLILNPGSFSSYVWQDNSTSPAFKVVGSGTYTVTVKNAVGCLGTATVKIEVLDNCDDIYFPNAFTPNNDSWNDEFGPLPVSNLGFVNDYTLVIYNRYGQEIFKTNDPMKKWNGKFQGKLLSGNYVWYASYLYRGKARRHQGNLLIIK